MSEPCGSCGATDHGIYCPLLGKIETFTKDELELLANGFGFFVQEFPIPEDESAHALLNKLYRLIEESERPEIAVPVVP